MQADLRSSSNSSSPSTIILTIVVGTIFSSLTLVIIDSWIKYFLFGFEILAITIIFLVITTSESSRFEKSLDRLSSWKLGWRFSSETIPSILLIGMSVVLLILLIYRIDGGLIQLFFAMASACILVGYAVLNIMRMQKYFSKIEFFLVSFLTSIGVTGFLSIVLAFSDSAELGLCFSFLVIGIISFLATIKINRRPKLEIQPRSLSRNVDVLAIGACILFYIVFTVVAYPNAASLIGSDISRHYADSVTLVRTPGAYSQSAYLLFHSFQGSVFLLAGQNESILIFLSSFAFLNIFLPISVYTAAKRFLGSVDVRIPALATVFYTFLSNLSFIYFANLYLTSQGTGSNEYLLIVNEVAEKSYFGIINHLQPFVFLVPLTVSVIGVVTILAMLKNSSMPKYRYIGLFSFIVASLGLIHLPEIALFGVLVSIFLILYSKTFIRSRDALIATAIGFPIAMISFVIIDISVFERDTIISNISVLGAFLLPTIASIAALVYNYKKLKLRLIPSHLYTLISNRLEVVTVLVTILYMTAIILWFFIEDFKTSSLIEIGVVPTFLYPVVLGIVGLLAIFSIRNLRNQQQRSVILFLLFAILFLFIMGKVISFVNVSFVQMPYWEKRVPILMFVFASMLAPIPVIRLWDRVSLKRRNSIITTGIISAVIGSIFLSGFSSLATQIEYWYTRANGPQRLDVGDIDATEKLMKILDEQPSSATISPSEFSRHVLSFTTSAYQLPRQDILFSSKLPEVPLMILGGLPYDRVYLYIHDRDLSNLDTYSNSWISKNLLPSLPLVYENEDVRIFNATGLKFPQSESETAVAIPAKALSDKWLHAYDAVSKSSKNYTEILDQDSSLEIYNNIILTHDPVPSFSHHVDFTSKNIPQDFWKITGQWEQKDDGLHGFGNYTDAARNKNLLISDFTTDRDNMTFSALFKTDDKAINRDIATYAAFLLPWKDQTDIDMAGIAFEGNDIYAYFASIVNSKVTFYPQFPYSAPLVTGLKWDGDSLINMTVIRSSEVEDLYINGTKFLSRPIVNKSPGFVGIGIFGANNIIIKEFSVSTKEDAPLSYRSYYDYVANGGNLTVYNTNGYGAIFDMFNEMGPLEQQNDMDRTGHLPFAREYVSHNASKEPINTQLETGIYDIKTDLSSSSEDNGNLLSDINFFETKVKKGNIRYVDVYSLINSGSLSEKEKTSALANITNTLLEKDYRRTDFNYRKIPMIFQNMQAEGSLYMNTSFVAFPSAENAKLVDIRGSSENSNQFQIGSNLTWLKLSGYNNASIRFDNVTLPGTGGGLYVDLILGKDQTIVVDFDRNALVQAGTSNGSEIEYENVTSITLKSSQPMEIVARTPIVNLDGSTHFGNLYGGILTGIAGQDAIFDGRISFSILASDTYTLADNASFDGRFDTGLIRHDEFSPLITSSFVFDIFSYSPVVIAILAILIALAAIFLLYKRIF
ncbi:MAG: hypothetical protein GEU26_12250 [Nitrososphaeraceae archaeon]|nr:hypothetical protein [Nitrososphaeraceae archaeon]